MPIDYTLVVNALTSPSSFRPEVVIKNTRHTAGIAARIAEKTGQPVDACAAILGALPDTIIELLADGDGLVMENFLQFLPTLSGNVASAAGDLPPDSVFGISVRALGQFLNGFKVIATGHRVPGDSKAPEILELKAIGSTLTALRERDLLDILGNRLKSDPNKADEGVFFDPVAGGASVKATVYPANGEKRVQVQRPGSLTAGALYRVRIAARRTETGIVRATTFDNPITAA